MKHRPFKIFYGWWIVVVTFIISATISGGFYYGFTSLIDPIALDLGWSYTQISLASSLRGLELGLLAPLVGILVDRYGPRRIIFAGAIICAAGLVVLSRMTTLAMFYLAFVLIAIGTSGCTTTVMMTTIANWFKKNVGLAAGIVSCGMGFGGLMLPLLVKLIDIYTWRVALVILAIIILVIVLPLSMLIRHRPEQYGDVPDGQAETPAKKDNTRVSTEIPGVEFNVKRILTGRVFWRIALAYFIHLIVMSAVITHIMPYLGSVGVSRSNAAIVATAVPLISIIGRIGLGWLGDKTNRRLVAAGTFGLVSCGVLCFAYVNNAAIPLLIGFVFLFGTSYGGGLILRTALARDLFFGRKFGTVFGALMGINMAGAIIGPPLAGWVYDTWDSYKPVWLALALLPLISILLILSIRPAGHEDQ